jgi:hypothetical protein
MENAGIQIWEGELSDYRMDGDGILYGVSKQSPRTFEKLKKDFSLVKQITKNRKVCFILDNTNTRGYDIMTLNYSLTEIPKIYKAIAFVSRSNIGKTVSSFFLQLYSSETLPVEIFDNENSAKDWIKQFN